LAEAAVHGKEDGQYDYDEGEGNFGGLASLHIGGTVRWVNLRIVDNMTMIETVPWFPPHSETFIPYREVKKERGS
jgi:hypothetical protein